MNGPQITIALSDIWAAIGVLAMLLGVWWRLQWQITEAQRRIDKKVCRKEFDDFKLEIAERFVSRGVLEREIERLHRLMDEVKAEMHQLRQEIIEALKNGNAK